MLCRLSTAQHLSLHSLRYNKVSLRNFLKCLRIRKEYFTMCIVFFKQAELIQDCDIPNRMILAPPQDLYENRPRYYCMLRIEPAHRTNDHSICGRCFLEFTIMQVDTLHMYEEANYHSLCGVSGRTRAIRCHRCDRRIGRLIPAEECPECAERIPTLTEIEEYTLAQGLLVPITDETTD
ncbi:uncharacterized protein LOC132906999 [Bombus pascuorum]|uniref:uncharacterized protein LOC132906999 n=1 Tax=Bombus pascuorum TaxID=65598 RepID=UPI0021406E37|nr:uncharacterized protein LOC132906999 [Bombus pascuorum]